MSFKSSWRSLVACIVLASFVSSCSFLFVQPLKTNDNAREAPLKCTTSNFAPGLDTAITGWQVIRIMLAAGASESDYAGSGSSQGADIALGFVFGALALGSAIWGFNATDECRRAGGGLERRHIGRRNTQEERDEEAAAQARAATLANMAAQQAQAAGIAAHKASEAAGRADAGTPQ